jgi:hypothetical protein
MEIEKINKHERLLQKEIHKYISEPSRIFKTINGKRLQIISPGTLNVFEGPDFDDIAVLLDGYLIIGAAEFHKKSSDWNSHRHSEDIKYKNVILHIVLDNDILINENFETLVLSYEDILEVSNLPKIASDNNIFNTEELQNLALHRLLRKTSEAKKLLIQNGLKNTLSELTGNFIARYENKRNRHKYNSERLSKLVENISSSFAYNFLYQLENNLHVNVNDSMITLLKKQLSDEGSHLRRELIINSFLPIALALADDEARINLFVWYWSTTSLNNYGLLTRKFPEIPQNFLWQQQGMLEYIKQFGSQKNVASEMLKEYGFAEILSFYRLGRLPLEIDN